MTLSSKILHQKPWFSTLLLLLGTLLALDSGLYACSQKPAFNREQLFQDSTKNAVMPAYQALTQQSKALHESLNTLCSDTTETNLTQTQAAWKQTVTAWQHTALYRLGPAEKMAAISHIQYWPTKPASIEEEVAGDKTLDVSYVNQLGASRRSLPALGYLLFAGSSEKKPPLEALKGDGNTPARRCQFAKVLAEAISKKAEELEKAWKDQPAEKWVLFYDDPVLESQAVGPAFKAINKIVNEYIYQLAAAMDKKVGKPMGTRSDGEPRPENVELPYSRYSKDSLLATLEGLEKFYKGTYSGTPGLSLSDLIKNRKADTDTQIRKELTAAMDAVKAIPDSLHEAVQKNKDKVKAAYDAIKQLRITFSTDVVALLGVTTTFSDNDGD